RLGWSRWTTPFATVAVALVVIVVAATLFSLRGRPSGGTGSNSTHANATATALAQAQPGSVNGGVVMAISMDSSTDGWAIGLPGSAGMYPTPSGGNAAEGVAIFYHYTGSKWVQKGSVAGFNADGVGIGVYLKMLSPTDGWAYDGAGSLLHYDGVAWRTAAITIPGVTHVHIQTIDMVSPTVGWAAVYIGGGQIRFARFNGAGWTIEPITNLPATVDASVMAVSNITVTPQGDAWAVGGAAPINPTPSAAGVGLVFHRVGGQWVTQTPLNTPEAKAEINPIDIYMSGPTSGWIVGSTTQNRTTSEGTTQGTHTLLLRYDGQRWAPVTVPLGTVSPNDSLTQIVGIGADNIWVTGRSSAKQILPGSVTMSALLLHYDGQNWSQIWPDATIHNATSAYIGSSGLAMSPDGALWVVGGAEMVQGSPSDAGGPLFWRYTAGGGWSLLPATSGK
ncbi:MAG TPA: hypothetical protein VF725_05155, partial [Ktedonobacterales bacterium]